MLERKRRTRGVESKAHLAVVLAGIATAEISTGVEQVRELQAGALEARRVHVGRVVGDHAQATRIAQQARHSNVDGFKHECPFVSSMRPLH
ncbi:hypothetical protein D9M68_988790 [compost metagenome]